MLNKQTTSKVISLYPHILATVAKVLGTQHPEVEDIAHDVVARLLAGGLESYDGRASLKSYATTAARNTAINCRKVARNQGHESINATDYMDSDTPSLAYGITLEGPDGRAEIERMGAHRALESALVVCLDDSEQTFITALRNGDDCRDAGALVGWSPAKATRQRNQLAERLRKHLAQ